MKNEKDKNRLLSKISIDNDTGCWNYIGYKNFEGYGAFWMNSYKRSIGSHRASYIIFVGNIPENKVICHKCDNSSCINPEHLFLGEQKDNIKDKVLKNRQAKGKNHKCYLYPELILRGDNNPTCKVTDEEVKQIRELYKSTNMTYKDLSSRFGISTHQIGNIIRRQQRV